MWKKTLEEQAGRLRTFEPCSVPRSLRSVLLRWQLFCYSSGTVMQKSAQSACCQHGTSRAAFLARWLRVEFLGAGVEFKLTA